MSLLLQELFSGNTTTISSERHVSVSGCYFPSTDGQMEALFFIYQLLCLKKYVRSVMGSQGVRDWFLLWRRFHSHPNGETFALEGSCDLGAQDVRCVKGSSRTSKWNKEGRSKSVQPTDVWTSLCHLSWIDSVLFIVHLASVGFLWLL